MLCLSIVKDDSGTIAVILISERGLIPLHRQQAPVADGGSMSVASQTAVFNPVVQMTAFKQPVYCAQFPAAFQD
jgi:hypothetical protein